MENLSISDPQQPRGAGGPAVPQPPLQQDQLPAQMFTTAAQLLDLTDKKLMVVLRDGRKVIGVLRTWDQFANLILQNAIERTFLAPGTFEAAAAPESAAQGHGLYADIPRGTYLVRGENVLLLGEIDLDRDDEAPPGHDKIDSDVMAELHKKKKAVDKAAEKSRVKKLSVLGFEGENMGEILL
ncbi:small nuclear ribonucleoprotein [Grosmannia clavigera kw1407]|uniref:U6 snRNA-associated Sm-like protein LSm1 n=1 Tax=Grosmannia clavigera (strain kw1407 / UAMH 11150) TaxID=655863 RepID=F0XTZ5_GROCL|nr:small nuclear ribonucleoprotein [Grosmannia clavigera kw1407]EFW98598.1 small nuclear ribonucleoprotein [Grosmannia clavigera kw1407]